MALKILQPGIQPLGQFDGYDTDFLTLKGGEVVTFIPVLKTAGTDKAAADSFDGYSVGPTPKRPVVATLTYTTSTTAFRPFMLSDEGIAGYGTLFGTVVGGTVGQVVTGGTVLGPHTAQGSGKVTCWDKSGLYAVSIDACDPNATTGLQPTHPTLAVGAPLYVKTATSQLTPLGDGTAYGSGPIVMGHFVDFETNGSLVNTPNKLVAALNSPSGLVSSVGAGSYSFATFYFSPAL
jgi:hypothetical protein